MQIKHKKSALGFVAGLLIAGAILATAVHSQLISTNQLAQQYSKNQFNERQYFGGITIWGASATPTNAPLVVQDSVTGTNAFLLTSNAVPAVLTGGNTYVGITTNVATTNGAFIRITNGIVVGFF